MNAINKRLRELRKACKKTQAEMGKILGISVSGVSEIESGRRNVTEQHLIMLSVWKEKNVNMDWLRTGEGDMFQNPDFYTEIGDLVGEILEDSENPLYEMILDIVRTYIELDPKSQETIKLFVNKLRDNRALKKEG